MIRIVQVDTLNRKILFSSYFRHNNKFAHSIVSETQQSPEIVCRFGWQNKATGTWVQGIVHACRSAPTAEGASEHINDTY